jgi:hypothetical protein
VTRFYVPVMPSYIESTIVRRALINIVTNHERLIPNYILLPVPGWVPVPRLVSAQRPEGWIVSVKF